MRSKRATSWVIIGSLGLAPLAGCENLPGNRKEQGSVIGGVGGAAAGAAIAKNNRVLGALVGGALGAGGGYLVGAHMDKVKDNKKDEAITADRRAHESPATAEDVRRADTADLNNDGFVTLDEVVAMRNAGLSDKQMIDRLRATQQYFELTSEQEKYLEDRGVSHKVVVAMRDMNPENSRIASDRSDRISHD